MRVIPLIHTRVARPALIVERVAALENHAVYAAGTAKDLTPSVENPTIVHHRFGVTLIAPIIQAIANRYGKRCGHMDKQIPTLIHPTRRSTADKDKIVVHFPPTVLHARALHSISSGVGMHSAFGPNFVCVRLRDLTGRPAVHCA